MNNEIREKDHEWVKMFHSNIDRLLVSIENLFESRQPGAFNDELLTDKEVAHILKVSRRTLSEYRSNGTLPYYVLGGKVLYKRSEIEQALKREYNGKHLMNNSG